MTVTLTAAGQSAKAFEATQSRTKALNEWELAVRRMLELSASTGAIRDRILTMRSWLEANPWHEKHDERQTQYHRESMALDVEFAKIMDLSAAVVRIQRQFDDHTLDGLSALIGHPLYPTAGTHWIIYSQRLKTNDLFEITSAWLRDLRASDEAADGIEECAWQIERRMVLGEVTS